MANLPKYRIPIDKKFFQAAFKDVDLSQNEVADRLGIDRGAMSLLMSGRRKMKIEEAATLAQVLGVPIEKVILRSGATRPVITEKSRTRK